MSMSLARLGPPTVVLLLLAGAGNAVSQVDPEVPEAAQTATPGAEAASPHPLDVVSADLAALRFEGALEGIEAFLATAEPQGPDRLRALVLRSQAHVALGRFDAAEGDYRGILELHPGFRPDPAATPRRALERFERVSRQLVGRVRLLLVPATASVHAGGVELTPGSDGTLALLAGDHSLLISSPGFDAMHLTVQVPAGGEASAEVTLVPNARSVVFRTEPEGVEVFIDGVLAGTTSRGAEAPLEAAQLVIEHLPLGEHLFELRRPCFRSERRRDLLSADLLDPTPRIYSVVALVPVRASIELDGGPKDAEVRVDDVARGRLPLPPIDLCPGERRIEVERAGRLVWSSTERLVEGDTRKVRITARPNAIVVGPPPPDEELSRLAEHFNIHHRSDWMGPPQASVETWASLQLPGDADLVIAMESNPAAAGSGVWHLYNPVVGVGAERVPLPRSLGAPQLEHSTWGFSTADGARLGPAVVIAVVAGGSAAQTGLRVGERVVSLDGERVHGTEELAGRLASRPTSLEAALGIDGAEGRRVMTIRPREGYRLPAPDGDAARRAVDAAWLRAIAASEVGTARSATALAGLALHLSVAGRNDASIEAWRQVDWPERVGLGRGTAQYFLGRALVRAGRLTEAAEAFRQAASSTATAWSDAGPPVAPAARDRLTDLGHAR